MSDASESAGARFRQALHDERPLQIVGAINALTAMMAEQTGFQALYLSGSGVAAASYGLPDLGITTLDNVAEDARRITDAVDLPLLVDIDTGFGGTAFSIARTIRTLEKIGVGAVHIEDQILQKRCGHRPGKQVVDPAEMCDRIRAATDARASTDFVIIARTDAFANEGMNQTLERANRYVEAGADAIFAEALLTLEQFQTFVQGLSVPILANLTEFGKTPLFTLEEMQQAGVGMVLYPLTAFRAMNHAAEETYRVLRSAGTQQSLLKGMQTREALYNLLDYYRYEEQIDRLYNQSNNGETP